MCVFIFRKCKRLFGRHTFRCFEKLDLDPDGPERPPGRHCGDCESPSFSAYCLETLGLFLGLLPSALLTQAVHMRLEQQADSV